jgi:hypothetical protein
MDKFLEGKFKTAAVAQLEALSLIDLEGLRKYFKISVTGLRIKYMNPVPSEQKDRIAITGTGQLIFIFVINFNETLGSSPVICESVLNISVTTPQLHNSFPYR